MSKIVIGECGNCGGQVTQYEYWAGTPGSCPRPSCEQCEARTKASSRKLEMELPPMKIDIRKKHDDAVRAIYASCDLFNLVKKI